MEFKSFLLTILINVLPIFMAVIVAVYIILKQRKKRYLLLKTLQEKEREQATEK